MTRTTIALALLAAHMMALPALAQSSAPAGSTIEFGRAFGGEIDAITKHSRNLSGSLGLSRSTGADEEGYAATLGGSLVPDRLWFFASASRVPAMELGARLPAVDAVMTAQPVDWSTISASFSDRRNAIFATPQASPAALPSSFLSLRSTSILSDNMLMSISISRQTTRPASSATPW